MKVKKEDVKKEPLKNEGFDFDNEIVIGVNIKEDKKNSTIKKGKNSKKNKSKKKKNIESKKEKKEGKKKNKIIIFFLSSISLIVVLAIFTFTAPLFNITNIDVDGNNIVPKETIISLSGLKKGENIFKFNNQIIAKIKENQYIDTVKIKRNLPGNVIISVKEREIKYQINLINSFAYIDKNGYILENSTIKKEVPTIVGFKITENELINKTRLDIQDLEKLKVISKIMEAVKNAEINSLITEINTENEKDYILYIENKKIYIGDASNLTNKMLYIKTILQNVEGKSGTLFINGDLGSGFKPYFREE